MVLLEEVIFSWREAPSDCFWWPFRSPPHDILQQPQLAGVDLKRKRAARGQRAPREPSIVDGFCGRPWQECVADSVAPPACHLALAAARASPAALGEDAQHATRHATIPDEPTGVGQASPWPRSGEQGGEMPWRTGSFTRSRKAVFTLPEKPNPCKEALKASSVPRRITCVRRTSLRRRYHVFTWP
jgi:hypothetical protein